MAQRIFHGKDVDMLLASKIICQSLLDNQHELSVVRTKWTKEYASDLAMRIDKSIEKYLGNDKKKELRKATATLKALLSPAMRDLSFIKTQIEVDFKDEAPEILKRLGLAKKLREIRRSSQESIIQVLYHFKQNLSESLKNSIIEKGTNPALLQGIVNYANEIKEANLAQEQLKGTSKELSKESVVALNDIYEEIIGICKISANYYQSDPLKKERFSFSKVVANMSHKTK